jgi:hypothetical protein
MIIFLKAIGGFFLMIAIIVSLLWVPGKGLSYFLEPAGKKKTIIYISVAIIVALLGIGRALLLR